MVVVTQINTAAQIHRTAQEKGNVTVSELKNQNRTEKEINRTVIRFAFSITTEDSTKFPAGCVLIYTGPKGEEGLKCFPVFTHQTLFLILSFTGINFPKNCLPRQCCAFKYFIKSIGVTLVNKVMYVSTVQFYNTASVYQIVC